ncbi:hypothetical protein D3C71_21030 [compost metagenome]
MYMPAVNESPTIEALSALVQLGASDTLLGLAVRELVTSRQLGAAVVAGAPAGMSMQPPGAEGPASAARVSTPRAPAAPAPSPAPQKPAKPEIVVFKKDGVRSSVSIAPSDWTALVAAAGGDEEAVRMRARELAKNAPDGVNRSKWTRDQLLQAARKTA